MTNYRLPEVNGDDGSWGTLLNQYLTKEHYNNDAGGAGTTDSGGHQIVTLRAGLGSTNPAPLTFTSGSLISTASTIAGAIEFYSGRFYLTATTATAQKAIATYADDANGATGDIYYRDASANFVKLGIGSLNDVLKVSGSPALPSWGAAAIADANVSFTDVITNNASTTAHGFVVKATAPASGLMNFVGITNAETAYTNKPLFDSTNPAALGTAGPGTQVIAARRDHVHANPAIDTLATATDITTLNASTTAHGLVVKATAPAANILNVVGIANGETVYANKSIFDGTTPAGMTVGGSGTPGTLLVAAHRDHTHSITNPALDTLAATTDITTLNASTTAHGLVVKAVAPASGLRNVVGIDNAETAYTNKALFDTTNPAALGTAGPGTQLIAARRDHVHANPAVDTLAAATDITTLNATTSAHGLVVKATAPASGLMNFVGITNAETVYTNKPLFDTTNPAALGTAGPGTQVIAARRDHIHANPALDTLAATTDITTLDASTTAHGLVVKATAPAAGDLNVVGIANGATAYTNKTIFSGLTKITVSSSQPGSPTTGDLWVDTN
jgi:hypothetical protein